MLKSGVNGSTQLTNKRTRLRFKCNYCDAEPFPHFKALVDHYQECHAGLVKRYDIKRINKKATALIYATTEDEAAYGAGWDKKDCKIKEFKDER